MTAPDNPYFSRALVNRYWKHFFSRGLVDPEDDMRRRIPASNPELLAALAQHFVKSRFDLKDLVRTICQSQVYQLSAEANAYNLEDNTASRPLLSPASGGRGLLDSIDDVLMTKSNLGGAPSIAAGCASRATAALPLSLTILPADLWHAGRIDFLRMRTDRHGQPGPVLAFDEFQAK